MIFNDFLIDIKKIEEKLIILRKNLETLENKRDKLNANTELSVNISQETANILGISIDIS